jgi:hypothetical protein
MSIPLGSSDYGRHTVPLLHFPDRRLERAVSLHMHAAPAMLHIKFRV